MSSMTGIESMSSMLVMSGSPLTFGERKEEER